MAALMAELRAMLREFPLLRAVFLATLACWALAALILLATGIGMAWAAVR